MDEMKQVAFERNTPVLGDEDTPRKAEHACGEGPQMEPCRNKEQAARDAIEDLLAEISFTRRERNEGLKEIYMLRESNQLLEKEREYLNTRIDGYRAEILRLTGGARCEPKEAE